MLLQLDIPKQINKKLKVKKEQEDFQNLNEVINFILNEYFKKENKK